MVKPRDKSNMYHRKCLHDITTCSGKIVAYHSMRNLVNSKLIMPIYYSRLFDDPFSGNMSKPDLKILQEPQHYLSIINLYVILKGMQLLYSDQFQSKKTQLT